MKVRSLSDGVQKDVLKFMNDSTTGDAFEAHTLPKGWSNMSELYPDVAEVPMRVLLMFPSTYLWNKDSRQCSACKRN